MPKLELDVIAETCIDIDRFVLKYPGVLVPINPLDAHPHTLLFVGRVSHNKADLTESRPDGFLPSNVGTGP